MKKIILFLLFLNVVNVQASVYKIIIAGGARNPTSAGCSVHLIIIDTTGQSIPKPNTPKPIISWYMNSNCAGTPAQTGEANGFVFFPSGESSPITRTYSANIYGECLTYTLTINPKPTKPGIISGYDTVCQGQTYANYFIKKVPFAQSYSWKFTGGYRAHGSVTTDSTDGTSISYLSNSKSGILTVMASDNCGTLTAASSLSITVKPPLVVTAKATSKTICAGQSVTLTGIGAKKYSWNQGVTNGLPFSPSKTATYTLTGMSGGCMDIDSIAVTLTICTGVFSMSQDSNIKITISPNPTKNIINITGIKGKESIKIFDQNGKMVFDSEIENDTTIDKLQLCNGIYTLVTENSRERTINKVIIEK